MKTIKINLYTIEELETKAREKAIEDHRQFESDKWTGEYTLEDWTSKLEEMGYIDPKIQFSGFWSQGDGASFSCKSVDLLKWLKYNKMARKFKSLKPLIEDESIWVEIERINSHYSHENTCTARIYDTSSDTSGLVDELQERIEQDRELLCGKIYKNLQTDYDYCTSDEQVTENIKANEYTYEANGNMRNA